MNFFNRELQKTQKFGDMRRNIFSIRREKVLTASWDNLQKPFLTFAFSIEKSNIKFSISKYSKFSLIFFQIFSNILLTNIEIMMTNKSVKKNSSVISKLHFFIVLVYVTTSVTLASPVDINRDVTSSRHNSNLLVDIDATPEDIAQLERASHSEDQMLAKREEQIQNLATSVLGSSR